MAKISDQLYAETESYVREVLTHQLPEGYTYHTLDHTLQVVNMSKEIGNSLHLEDDEIKLLQLAAWFHDIGYIKRYIGHEEEGKQMARSFFSEKGLDETLIQQIEALIESTKVEKPPKTTLEKVIKDADLYNLAIPEALENSQYIRQEWKFFCNRDFTDAAWDEFNYNFFKNHEYYTDYAKDRLEPKKLDHLRKLKKIVKKRKKKELEAARALLEFQVDEQETEIDKLKRKLKKVQQQRPDRGIETMFRTTYRTHINLSSIADNKANILLSINAIIISIVFSNILTDVGGLEDLSSSGYMIWMGMAIMGVSLATIVYAILSTRPKVSSGIFTREDILQKKTNLLFFGNFHSMDVDDYLWGMGEMMKDADYLYGSMAKDIYFLGRVLAKKFQYLRIAYNIFMYGIGVIVVTSALILLGVQFSK